ncbi:MAG TPA: Gfo/Idh/MocA family oxidoreductase [Verrucomicrobiae bacterium]|nr:Gfo/Idh/MocA family oxidoreductase [Verrucomicrobiae bacterium]
MSKKYRVGIVGFAHPHINHVASLFSAHQQVEWVACADTRPVRPELRVAPYTREWNRGNVMKSAGISKCYEDYHEMLGKERFDLVLVECENAQHPEVVEACAEAGAHVCVEKPMAVSLVDARRMDRACQAAGTMLAVNWPPAWLPHARKAKEVIDSGMIGRVLEVDYRVGHGGPFGAGAEHKGGTGASAPLTDEEKAATWFHQKATGGGAFLDLCCYGVVYSLWYIGERATAVQGMKANLSSHWCDAEDNGVIVLRYPSAIAVAQGSWTTMGKSYLSAGPLMVYGEGGSLSFEIYGDQPVVRVVHGPERKVEMVQAAPLPKHRSNLPQELFHHLETGEPLHEILTPEFNLDATAIVDAGARSAENGGLETVSDPSRCPCAGC